jgi:hypothetical protein
MPLSPLNQGLLLVDRQRYRQGDCSLDMGIVCTTYEPCLDLPTIGNISLAITLPAQHLSRTRLPGIVGRILGLSMSRQSASGDYNPLGRDTPL